MKSITECVTYSYLTFGFFQLSLVAQVQVESGLALEQYVNEILLGNNGVASNITYVGGASQLGHLSEGEEVFSFNSGLVLSCDVAEKHCMPWGISILLRLFGHGL
jgi:hypothetical protein